MEAKFLVGIDLGTSNCAVAFCEIARGPEAEVEDFLILQARRPNEALSQKLLPSCLYIPGPELAPDAAKLPWPPDKNVIVGELARWQGAQVPGRLVTSAKSWLCHGGVDRAAPILPWAAPAGVEKLSPVDASALIVSHIKCAWNDSHPDAPLEAQEVILTVPASFDEVARALTVNAVRQAGLEKFTLLEEPQAAFYHFISRHRKDLAKALENIRLVLVIDVGGGTTDFTLIQCSGDSEQTLNLKRIAVGDHLILGGDNMDVTLARFVEQRLKRKLAPGQWHQLIQRSREAKELLLSENALAETRISILSEGSQLIGGAISAALSRAEVEQIILDGFLPCTAPQERPQRASRVALQEFGLPFVPDPAISRHLAAFLADHAGSGFKALGIFDGGSSPSPHPDPLPEGEGREKAGVPEGDVMGKGVIPTVEGSGTAVTMGLPRPDAILLNGGVFNGPKIASRMAEVLARWWPDRSPPALLEHGSLDLAVARGAAYYGLARHGWGRRIGGGAARAFYIGLGKKGEKTASSAMCVIPRGHEEGQTVELTEQKFNLNLGKPVQFPLFSTTSDRVDRSGEIVPLTDQFLALPPIHTVLKSAHSRSATAPVVLRALLTEIGTLELWCVSKSSEEKWRLEFELREAMREEAVTTTEPLPANFALARAWIENLYGSRAAARAVPPVGTEAARQAPRNIKQLWSSLEGALGRRETWRTSLLRELWGALHAAASKRRRSEDHERVFFQLTGFSLRPGFGYPLDQWRCEQTFKLFSDLVQFHKEKPNWNEFWILWRRVSGGLDASRQFEIWEYLKPQLASQIGPRQKGPPLKQKGPSPEGLDEMIKTAAALEQLPVTEKIELGHWLAARLERPEHAKGPYAWALGRLGARAPVYGSIHQVTPPEVAQQWLHLLWRIDPQAEGRAFAIVQIARRTGDRTRDLDDVTRAHTMTELQSINASDRWLQMVAEVTSLGMEDEARALGDSLPPGLTV